MEGSGARPLGAVPPRSAACEALVDRVARQIEPRVDAIAEQLIDRVVAEMGFDPDDTELRGDLLAAARGSVALVTAMARSWSDPRIVPPPHDALLWARSLVARRIPADALLRVYRIGQAGYQEMWIRELAAAGAPESVVVEAISAIAAFVFTWIDAISTPLLDAYDDEMSRRLRGVEAVRAETIALALSGRPFDAAAASARLRYDLARDHLAVLAWIEPGAPDAAREALETQVEAVVAVFAAPERAPLMHRETPGTAVAWIPAATPNRERLAGAAALLRGSGVRLAVGAPGRGARGFRESHDTALRARRVARLLRRSATVTAFADVAILDLLTQDLPAARALAAATLGPLAGDDDRARRLLATLRVFFREGQSFARAARRLGIHENTIADRVRRALQLTGHDAADLYALRTAVELAPLLEAGAGEPAE